MALKNGVCKIAGEDFFTNNQVKNDDVSKRKKLSSFLSKNPPFEKKNQAPKDYLFVIKKFLMPTLHTHIGNMEAIGSARNVRRGKQGFRPIRPLHD